MDALAAFREMHGYEISCVLSGQDGGFWATVRHRISELGLKEVYYLGRVGFEEVIWLYQNCEAVLALGLHESSSLPVREGAVFGKPLICSDIPPNIETQAYLALNLVGRSDHLGLTQILDLLVRNDVEIRKEAQLNRDRVQYFNWDLIAKNYLAVIKECR